MGPQRQPAYRKTCTLYHVRDGVGTNSISDLRFMDPEALRQLKGIALKGVRSTKGMQSFADIVSDTDANTIQPYLVVRAREDYKSNAALQRFET